MNELGVILLTLLEAVSSAVRSQIGAKRTHTHLKPYMLSSEHNKVLPMFIRKHFHLSDKSMHMAVGYRYIISYYLFVRPFVLVFFALLMPFRYYLFAYAGSIYSVVLIVIPLIVIETVTVASANKRIKKLKSTKKKMTFLGFFDSIGKEIREVIDYARVERKLRSEREWRKPLTKDLSRCLRKYKGVDHMFSVGLSYAEEKVLPKYNEYVVYEILQNEKHKTFLRVYAKSDGALVFQAPVREK